MSPDDSFAVLLARLRAGDERAAELLVCEFTTRLLALARSRLQAALRGKVDAEDVVQSVFKSFFVRQAAGQFELTSRDGLWGLLARLTVRKCTARARYFRTEGRDVHREVSAPAADPDGAEWEALAHEPTPEEAAVLTETVELLVRELGNRGEILVLALQGEPVATISAQLGCSERTVYRVLEIVGKRLKHMHDEKSDPP
jgi:RNA polymerase sigma-70 factor (ECF subfamily)